MRGLSTWIVLGWSVAFAMLIVDAAISFYNIEELVANDRAVAQSRDVSRALADLMSALKDAETAIRGFAITDVEEYLKPFENSQALFPVYLNRLRNFTLDDPYYHSQLEAFATSVDRRVAILKHVIEIQRRHGAEAARLEIKKDDGRKLMDQIRDQVVAMEIHEQEVLVDRSQTARLGYQRSFFTTLGASLLAIVMVGLALSLVRVELRRREKAEARFRTLTEAIPQMVWNTDASGRVTYFNRRWVEYTGLSSADAVESWWTQVAHPDDAERLENAWRRAVSQTTESFTEEGRIRDIRDGSYQWFLTTVAPLRRSDGTVEQWIGSLSSIDEQRRHAELLAGMVKIRTAELESANQLLRDEVSERTRAEARAQTTSIELARSNEELEKFAYVASHDLQEPLRKIQAFGDRLSKKFRGTLGPDGVEYVDRMQFAAGRMRRLIDDLLAFSRVTSKGQPFSLIDLTAIAHDVVDDLDEQIQQSSARIDLGNLPHVMADPLQMRQLFQNLIGNSLKFRKPDTPPIVTIRAVPWEKLPPDADPPPPTGSGIRITVADNGIGFDQTYSDRVFELFQRLNGRGEYEGTGIGLAICRKIVQRHKGQITVRAKEGEGSTFVIDLPTETG